MLFSCTFMVQLCALHGQYTTNNQILFSFTQKNVLDLCAWQTGMLLLWPPPHPTPHLPLLSTSTIMIELMEKITWQTMEVCAKRIVGMILGPKCLFYNQGHCIVHLIMSQNALWPSQQICIYQVKDIIADVLSAQLCALSCPCHISRSTRIQSRLDLILRRGGFTFGLAATCVQAHMMTEPCHFFLHRLAGVGDHCFEILFRLVRFQTKLNNFGVQCNSIAIVTNVYKVLMW